MDIVSGGLASRVSMTFGAPRQMAVLGTGTTAYDAASYTSKELGNWHPGLRSPDAEAIPSRDKITARSRDLARNNSWTVGGVDLRADAVVGARIRLEARPDFEAIGQTADWADEWSTQVEAKFRTWANDSRMLCDVERHYQFGGLVRLAYSHYLVDGEAAGAIYWLERGGAFATSVLVIDPDRLSNPNNAADTNRLRGGIELDAGGHAAQAYHIRVEHPADLGTSAASQKWVRIPREGKTGRPLFVHVFNKRRAQQRRGVSTLAPIIKRLKMLDRYDNAELEAALLNAVMAATITSPFQSEDVRAALAPSGEEIDASAYSEARLNYREHNKVTLNGVQINHLFPGEEMKFASAERPAAQFPAFESAVLRSVAAGLGVSYEQLSRDWSEINYSSARTLLNEIWRGFMADRHLFTQAFCAQIYSAWLEEAVARGVVQVPGGVAAFYSNRAAFTACEWIGPGRGTIDPKKEQEAADLALAGNRSNLAIEAAEQGLDYRDVLVQRSREKKLCERLGLDPEPPQPAGPGRPSEGGEDTSNDRPADTRRREAA